MKRNAYLFDTHALVFWNNKTRFLCNAICQIALQKTGFCKKLGVKVTMRKMIYMTIALVCIGWFGAIAVLINALAQAPKQAQIAFDSNRDGNYEIYVMDADGNNPRNLTNHPAEDESPSWFDPSFERPIPPAGKQVTTWGWLKRKMGEELER